jgi:2,4-dienoyl-CoA reductase-like NADH-dependent reductase (Old Yellow Enzyme family)
VEQPWQRAYLPGRLGSLSLRNRILKTATFEGYCPGGVPSDGLVEHHRRVAAGGVALTTVAYCSVAPDGRTYEDQMVMSPEIVPVLRRLTDAVHAEGAAVAIQLGHAGYFASPRAVGGRPLGASRKFCLYGLSYGRTMTPEVIARIEDDYERSARLAREAGFDAIELHAGHGYLLSQFLSPFTNRRKDAWGGPLEHLLKLPLEVLRRTRAAVGPDFPILPKMNLEDGFRRGLQLDEAVAVARAFADASATALVLSGGFVTKTPFYMLRGDLPVRDMVAVQHGWIRKVGLSLFGRIMVPRHEFTELFFLPGARRIRAEVSLPLVYVGGVCSRANLDQVMADGFDFVALGRALVRDPDFVRRLERGEIEATDCDHCNRCVAEMDRGGLQCVCTLEEQRAARARAPA